MRLAQKLVHHTTTAAAEQRLSGHRLPPGKGEETLGSRWVQCTDFPCHLHLIFFVFKLTISCFSSLHLFKRTFVENAQPLCQLHQVCFETLESGYNILSFLLVCVLIVPRCQSSEQLQPLRLSQILSLLLKPKE